MLLKKWLVAYFSFTKREYNGLLTLIFILILITAFPYVYQQYFVSPSFVSTTEQNALAKLVLVNKQQPSYSYQNIQNEIEDTELKKSVTVFNFDPNTISLSDWQKLGLSVKQAQSIINYRNKGGKFYKPEDLQKMYTISAEKYEALLPYIKIDGKDFGNKFEKKSYPDKVPYAKKELAIIEINNADTLQLDEIRGVGAAFARRIANYRNKLGGFYKKEQLLEVYGLDTAKYLEIKDQIKIDASAIKKININTATFDDLKSHPYLKFKQINAIIQYRKQHGNFNHPEDLKKVLILSPQTIQNLTPYLTF